MLLFMGLQRVRQNLMTEHQQQELREWKRGISVNYHCIAFWDNVTITKLDSYDAYQILLKKTNKHWKAHFHVDVWQNQYNIVK